MELCCLTGKHGRWGGESRPRGVICAGRGAKMEIKMVADGHPLSSGPLQRESWEPRFSLERVPERAPRGCLQLRRPSGSTPGA